MRLVLKTNRSLRSSSRSARGVSIVELLLALAISAMLLTATVLAVDASFQSYAVAAESASTQSQTRMVAHRVMMLVRNSTAHEPMTLAQATSFDSGATILNGVIQTNHIVLLDPDGRLLRIWWDSGNEQLWMDELDLSTLGVTQTQPIIDGVTQAIFYCKAREDEQGVLVLERGSLDLQVEAPADSTLDIERASTEPMRLIVSTMPRRLQ